MSQVSNSIISKATSRLIEKGVIEESTQNGVTTYIGMSNKRKASIVHPFYSEEEEKNIDVDQEVERLIADVETQIRMGAVVE